MQRLDSFSSEKTSVRTIVPSTRSIADEVCNLAKDEKADLIIIGNMGLGGLSETLGSVSRGASERAHCPVTIVH